MMTFDTNLKATTQDEFLPKAIDAITGANVMTLRSLALMKRWRGEQLSKTIITAFAGNGGSYSGADKFNTNSADTKQKMQVDIRGYEQPVTIIGMEADANASSNRSVELVGEAMEEATNEMSDGIGTVLYGDGTGNTNKDFLGYAAGIDDGGEVDSYGGLSRATHTALKANETDVGGALTLAGMATMFSSCKSGSKEPTIIYTTESIWDDYEALAQPTLSINQDGYGKVTATGIVKNRAALKGELGFSFLSYRGTPVVADEKCTSETMWFVNEPEYAFYGLPCTLSGYSQIKVAGNSQIEGYYADEAKRSLGFSWSGFLRPIDQYAEVGHILLNGNFVTFHSRRHGVLNTIS